ncbi:hypothetical protein CAPTEDRAFT_100147, partial [Capitella teleta]
FLRIPMNPAKQREWHNALKNVECAFKKSTHVCSKHFREEDLDRTGATVRVREGVVPTIFQVCATQ